MSQKESEEIKVWDPLIRIFHWSLVTAFFVAYLAEDDLLQPHVVAGYFIIGLLAVRLIWGIVGTRHARFSDFVFRPSTVFAYLKDEMTLKARRFIGHNPAGGAMVIALLVGLVLISVSGVALYAVDEHAGPLAGLLAGAPAWAEDVLEELHEFFANATLALVGVHVVGVLAASALHGENLVRAMITGRKRA